MAANFEATISHDPEFGWRVPERLKYKGNNKFCPLCYSSIRLYYINTDDKLAMCENVDCDFPFGHQKPKIIKPGENPEDETYGITVDVQSMPDDSIASQEVLPQFLDDDSVPDELRAPNEGSKKKQRKPKFEDKILKNIEDINKLNEELLSLNEEPYEKMQQEEESHLIRNEKWIKNLKSLQELSGVQLLRPEEICLLKKEEPVIGLGELKIDIGQGTVSTAPSIKIEIHNSKQEDPVTSAN